MESLYLLEDSIVCKQRLRRAYPLFLTLYRSYSHNVNTVTARQCLPAVGLIHHALPGKQLPI